MRSECKDSLIIMSSLGAEQDEILRIIGETIRTDKISADARKLSWNKFNGDVSCRVVGTFLQRHMPNGLKVAGPGVFIHGYPMEFDLLVLDSDAEPLPYTNSYPDKKVKFVVEVKGKGGMDKDHPSKQLAKFDAIAKKFPHIRCVYFTIRETGEPKRPNSINYLKNLRTILEPRHRVFCLKDSRTNDVYLDQWGDFVNCTCTQTR